MLLASGVGVLDIWEAWTYHLEQIDYRTGWGPGDGVPGWDRLRQEGSLVQAALVAWRIVDSYAEGGATLRTQEEPRSRGVL